MQFDHARLRETWKKAGDTDAAVARRLEISPATAWRIRTGTSVPSSKTLARIEQVYGLTAATLYGVPGMSSPAPGDTTLLDAVATAYASDPPAVEPLLQDLADATGRATYMASYPRATDYGRECATAAADAARDELLAVLNLPQQTEAAA